MSKTNPGNFFEDFQLGQRLTHATPRTITAGDVALYVALTGSRFALHSSAPLSKQHGFRDLLVDDLLAFHIAFGKTVSDISLNAVANLGYADVRFLAPVYIGDTLRAESEVIGLKQNSNGKSGVVYVRSDAFNQDDEQVFTWIRWVMVHKRDSEAPSPESVIPELPGFVAAESLPIAQGMDLSGFDTTTSGSPHLWDDYETGERIDHVDGISVDESDHTLATKLYQNSAKVHFNQHQMAESRFGKRLMYGGHVISICRALSHNGLGNALRIAAINGGSHSNPSFAGDTFYAWTEVLDKWELPGRSDVGALRLRTIGAKNCATETIASAKIEVDGKSRYRDEVVLDLDYTVLMPRR